MNGSPAKPDPLIFVHELNRRIQEDPTNKSKIIREFYSERVKAGDREGADLVMLIREINDAKGSIPKQPIPVDHTDAWRTRYMAGAAVALVVCTCLGLWYFYRQVCRDPKVPKSHFVSQKNGNHKLVVFVHGVLGDMDNTWVNPDTQASWPEMLAKG
jgi:hypothetical protein